MRSWNCPFFELGKIRNGKFDEEVSPIISESWTLEEFKTMWGYPIVFKSERKPLNYRMFDQERNYN